MRCVCACWAARIFVSLASFILDFVSSCFDSLCFIGVPPFPFHSPIASAVEGSKAGLNLGQEIQQDQRYILSNYSGYIYTTPRVCEMPHSCDVKWLWWDMEVWSILWDMWRNVQPCTPPSMNMVHGNGVLSLSCIPVIVNNLLSVNLILMDPLIVGVGISFPVYQISSFPSA